MRFFHLYVAATIFLTGSSGLAYGETPEKKGAAIAQQAQQQTRGFSDYTANGKMILQSPGTGRSVREFSFRALSVTGGLQTLLVFSWPGDIRDTGLLTHNRDSGSDDQWIYLSASRQVRRISSSSRSGSFVGSEFAYEDLVDQDASKFTYLWLRDEGCCHVVERHPKYNSGYSKQVVWFDLGSKLPVRIEYTAKRGSISKVLEVAGYQRYQGRVWRPGRMTMTNLVTGKSTVLTWTGYRFDIGLGPAHFTTRALERGQ